jgi:SAM-dependent methyltransferase
MEHVNCDFCGGRDFEDVVSQTDVLHKTTNEFFCIVRCKQCGLNFLNPRPEVSEIGRFYSEGYTFHAKQSRLKLTIVSILTWLANSRLSGLASLVPGFGRRLIPYIKPEVDDPVRLYFQGSRILDIGCGSGDSAHFWGANGSLQAYRKFAEVHGLEVADGARQVLESKGIPAYKCLSDVPSGLKFDIIRMNWSLEHVHSPAEYFDFISRHLSENGKAIIAVPNFDGMIYMFAKECVEVPIHLYHFRKQDIQNYAQKFGLDILEFRSFSYPQMFVYAAEIFPGIKKFFPSPLKLSEAYHFQKFLNRFDAMGMGNDMIVVLERK